jgi:hypothetical protein
MEKSDFENTALLAATTSLLPEDFEWNSGSLVQGFSNHSSPMEIIDRAGLGNLPERNDGFGNI